MENPQRDVPRSIVRAGLTAVVAYAAFLITILLVLTPDQLTGVGSFLTAFKSVDVVLGFVISTATLAYLFIFPSFLIMRYKYAHVPRVYKVPGGMIGAWMVRILAFAYALFAVIGILVPITPPSSVTRFTYELTQFIPLALIVLLTIVFYIMGHSNKANQDVIVELNRERAAIESNIEGIGGE